MTPHAFKVGDDVRWVTSILDLVTRQRRSLAERGAIYRIDAEWIAVLPDAWKREGKTLGVLRKPEALTLIPKQRAYSKRAKAYVS